MDTKKLDRRLLVFGDWLVGDFELYEPAPKDRKKTSIDIVVDDNLISIDAFDLFGVLKKYYEEET